MTVIGNRIKQARKDKKISQTELAQLLGVTQPTIVNWETGHHEPKHASITQIADALNVRRLWLFSGLDDPIDGQPLSPSIANQPHPYLNTPIVHIPVLDWPASAETFLQQPLQSRRHLSASLWALQPFALAIQDQAMAQEFALGTFVIFDAARTKLYDGQLYLFNWNGSAILRHWRNQPNRLEAAGDPAQFETLFPDDKPTVIARALLAVRELA